ncbi:MAG: glycosyltransferase family 9 protein [Rhabdochlamydiaceae bacterium]
MLKGKCAIFSCLGLGDGLISLVLAHNLKLNGAEVHTFHPMLDQMQGWFPHLPVLPFSSFQDPSQYDHFFIFYEKSERMLNILKTCQSLHPEKTHVLNPIATMKTDYPYWEEGEFRGDLSFVHNLYNYAQNKLHLEKVTISNGLLIPPSIHINKDPLRVIIHPTSSKASKNWLKSRFIKLRCSLKERGFNPVFVVSPREYPDWKDEEALTFPSLNELATFVAGSGYMVGNDSGIGHLASNLGLPTLTICRRESYAKFWAPSWSRGKVIYPSNMIPNIKKLRIRDNYWAHFISQKKVLKTFMNLYSSSKIPL